MPERTGTARLAIYISSALLLVLFMAVAVLAARRDRLFLVPVVLVAAALVDGALWGIEYSVGGLSSALIVLGVALLITLREAVSLPRSLARLARFGTRDRDRDYDGRLTKVMVPFWAELHHGTLAPDASVADAKARIDRAGRRTLDGLDRANPPSDEWRVVRDGYAAAVGAALQEVRNGRRPTDAYRAYATGLDLVRAPREVLRDRDRPLAPPSPPWGLIVVVLIYVVTGSAARELLERGAEFIAPPSVAVGWRTMTIPFGPADSWAGDIVSDGARLYLIDREDIAGFWGATRVRSSDDGGASWSSPGAASLAENPETARPAIARAPDGSIWVALVHQGPEVATQLLQIGRSTDDGANWPVLARASPPSVGLVGLPILLVTPDVHLVAYTNGATGEVMIQPLDVSLTPQGQPEGSPATLGRTTRQLYSDASFLDAGVALAATGRHVVALWRPSDTRIAVAISDDAGRTWRAGADLSTTAGWDRPHLLAVGRRLVASWVERHAVSSGTSLVLASSTDGGTTWTGPTSLSGGFAASEGVVAVTGPTWQVVYAGCPGEIGCISEPRIWYRTSRNGLAWSEPQALTPPEAGLSVIGIGVVAGRSSVLWVRSPTGRAEDRVIEGLTR